MGFLKCLLKSSRCRRNYSIFLLLTVALSLFYVIQLICISLFTKSGYEYEDDEFPFFPDFQFEGEKIVHLDFKGAPPKISYVMDIIPFIKSLGATGILLEYEDMFPYHGELEEIRAANAYTPSDVAAIVETAEKNNLMIIPLVPTLSNFEFVLKLQQFKDFREVEDFPNMLCPSNEDVYPILYKMIDQVLQAHPRASYLHIGIDGADFLGTCTKCQSLVNSKSFRKLDIYFNHVKKLASYIASFYPEIRPIIWGDKLQKENEKIILRHQLPQFVDIMLWNHQSKKESFPQSNDMISLAKLFKSIWIAGSFKGAENNQITTNPEYYLSNVMAWMNFVSKWRNIINFKGIVLVGFQRLNHLSVLCELLPVGIPSLGYSLKYLDTLKGYDYDDVKHALDCNDLVPKNLHEMQNAELLSRLQCDYPGFKIYKIIQLFFILVRQIKLLIKKLDHTDMPFHVLIHSVFNSSYVQKFNLNYSESLLLKYNKMENDIRAALSEVYDQYTVDEWILTYMVPLRLRLEAAINILSVMRMRKVWPRRPTPNFAKRIEQTFNKTCRKTKILGCTFFYIY